MEVKGTVIKSEAIPGEYSTLVVTIEFRGSRQPRMNTKLVSDSSLKLSALTAIVEVAAEFPTGCTIKLMEKE